MELSKDTAEAWIKCDCINRGVTRLEAIESFLSLDHGKYFEHDYENLLIEWLEGTDRRFEVKYAGGFIPDFISVETDANNKVVGFTWQLEEYIGRDCDESYGNFTVDILGYEFEHWGGSYFNEGTWDTETWSGMSPELSAAIDAHIIIPHIEEYVQDVSCDGYDIDRAFDQLLRRSDSDVDGLLFYRDDNNGVYVFKGERMRNEQRETILVPLGKVPNNLIRIDQKEACKILAEQNFPFKQDS